MWLEYRVPKWVDKAKVKEIAEKSELDFVKFMMAGMPLPWKLWNYFVIIIPKLLIWRSTATNGVTFLMETAGIEDCIINVTALTFILNLDEMIFDLFAHKVGNAPTTHRHWSCRGFGHESQGARVCRTTGRCGVACLHCVG